MQIRTLICKRDLATGVLCLRSLINASEQPIDLIVHEDGTLDESDVQYLLREIPHVSVLRRDDHREAVQEQLKSYPNCLRYRDMHPLSNKLLDIPLLSDDVISFIDSDIMFFRKFTELFPDTQTPIFSEGEEQGYSAQLLKLLLDSKRALPFGCNTGLFRFFKRNYDLDYIEWFIGRHDLWAGFPGLLEQTCYALLFGYRGVQVFSPDQLRCTTADVSVNENTFAVHFLYTLKKEIPRYVNIAWQSTEHSRLTGFDYQSARKLTVLDVVKRRFNRITQ